ncbi:hypothetical protein [Roseobacter sinensis]|uniref:Uncharacterized protein n=1 Tax=Roseobacter sinensis TaxID=2931391 RepID=A0ABT3BKI0_9RHOB|nr:hypothetical protein [Roseobacter sp. WL0113]MCV3273864.1 hypothetical protein [Roseobacter sp. WL0113]
MLFEKPSSAFDAVTQRQTAHLIADVQAEAGFAALVIKRELGYAATEADDIAVLRTSQIEEMEPAKDFAFASAN